MHKNKYLIAVSGGPDSMALLDIIYHIGLKLIVCHVNYHWRDDSDNDELIVRDYCQKHKLECQILEISHEIYKKQKFNFENWARHIRYDFFNLIGKKYKINNLLVAHNLNDWLETAIIQDNKKSKSTYFGIKQNSSYKDLNIIRPVLLWKKSALEDYCKKHKINFSIDQTNFDTRYERNKVRKEINKWTNKKFYDKVLYFFKRNKSLQDLEAISIKSYKDWIKQNFDLNYFVSLEKKIQIQVIYKFLNDIVPSHLSSNKINAMRDFLNSSKKTGLFQINNQIKLRKQKNFLQIVK